MGTTTIATIEATVIIGTITVGEYDGALAVACKYIDDFVFFFN